MYSVQYIKTALRYVDSIYSSAFWQIPSKNPSKHLPTQKGTLPAVSAPTDQLEPSTTTICNGWQMVNSDRKLPFQCVLMVAKISFLTWIVKKNTLWPKTFWLPRTKPSKKLKEFTLVWIKPSHQAKPCGWQGTDFWDFKKVSNFTMYRRWVLRTGPMVVSGAEPSMEWKLRRGGLKAMEISSIPQGRREFSQGVLGRLLLEPPEFSL